MCDACPAVCALPAKCAGCPLPPFHTTCALPSDYLPPRRAACCRPLLPTATASSGALSSAAFEAGGLRSQLTLLVTWAAAAGRRLSSPRRQHLRPLDGFGKDELQPRSTACRVRRARKCAAACGYRCIAGTTRCKRRCRLRGPAPCSLQVAGVEERHTGAVTSTLCLKNGRAGRFSTVVAPAEGWGQLWRSRTLVMKNPWLTPSATFHFKSTIHFDDSCGGGLAGERLL